MSKPRFTKNYKPSKTKHGGGAASKNKKALKFAANDSARWVAQVVHEEFTGVAHLGITYNNALHGPQFALFDTDLAENPTKLRLALRKAGAALTGSKAEQLKHIQGMLDVIPSEHGVLAGKPGFRERGFILGRRLIGAGVQNFKWHAAQGPKASLGLAQGTLEDWQTNVAAPMKHSTYATFGICVALGACLPSYIELKRSTNPRLPRLVSETASYNFSGESGSGKSTIGRAVAGVYGAPKVSDWDFTKASFEESAEARNDLVLVIDDTETYLDESPSLKTQLRTVNQKIPGGISKGRSQAVASQSYANLSWRAFGMTSSPKPIDDLAEELNFKRSKGEIVRYPNIAVPPPSIGGIFDELPGAEAAHGAASSALVEKLESSVASYYGTALPAFVELLLQKDQSSDIVALVRKFKKEVVTAGDGWDKRLAGKFAVAYAAGKLAVKAGILPWPDGWVFKAVVRCYRNALAGLAHDQQLLLGKLRNLQIVSADPTRFPTATSGAKAPIVYETKTLGVATTYKGNPVYAVRKEGMKAIAGSGAGMMALIEFIDSKGILMGGHGQVRTTQLPVPMKLAGNVDQKPRFYVLNAAKLAAYGADGKAA